jgi:two-component system sensor histidine kinase NreB
VKANLYRITQEALNNVFKHAKANHVGVIFERRGGEFVLVIEDDGIGFERVEQTSQDRGVGLLGMRERAALIGGTFEIETASGTGTAIFVRVPI